jgi:ribosomal protein S18 acetylase RimI-like enzyme
MIQIVPNAPEYFEFIRRLRNDPRVKDGFIEQGHITIEQQVAYMAQHASEYLVALCDDVPAGYAGSIDGDIRVCTHPDFQGRGVGQALIRELVERFPGSVAKVKVENQTSKRLFESCGFEVTFVLMEQTASDPGNGG